MMLPSSHYGKRCAPVATLVALVWLGLANAGFAQSGSPFPAEIKDTAGMFSKKAIEQAQTELGPSANLPFPVAIETVEDLQGQTVEETARQHAARSGHAGIYILIAKREHKIEVLVTKPYVNMVPEIAREQLQNTIIKGLRSGDFDSGLAAAVREVQSAGRRAKFLTGTANFPGLSSATPEGATSSLVLRNQVRLTLAGAHQLIIGAEAKAAAMGLKVNIAIVDDGGHMFAFERMDGARPASIYTATTKAITAATFRAPSGPIPPGTTSPDPLLNLSLQNAALASGGKLTTLPGGIPVIVDDQIIGAIGVGGGSGEQDTTIARAGIEAFTAALKTTAEADAPKSTTPAEK
jgi:glc operon protein GlcG